MAALATLNFDLPLSTTSFYFSMQPEKKCDTGELTVNLHGLPEVLMWEGKEGSEVLLHRENVRCNGREGQYGNRSPFLSCSNTILYLPAVRHLHVILSIAFTNSEIRKLLSDFSLITCDLYVHQFVTGG
jgi:hypothetical protein